MTQETNSTQHAAPKQAHFYRVVWRWHFYAGLLVIPFLLILSVTGIIYLFKPQLDTLMYRELMFVPAQTQQLPYTEQLSKVQTLLPNTTAISFRPAPALNRSSEVDVINEAGRHFTYFVNPYDGKTLGHRDGDYNLQQIAVKLHGELMIGKLGDYLVETVACWALVLTITGLYMWWPRKDASIWRAFFPRLSLSDRRQFWRDLHASAGLYGSLVIVFLILSGLPWAGFWGDTFTKIVNHYPAPLFNAPASQIPTGTLNQADDKSIPWAAGNMPIPLSVPAEHVQHIHAAATESGTSSRDGIAEGTAVNLDSVIAFAYARNLPAGFKVNLPQSETGVYTLGVSADDPRQEAAIHIDQYSGRVLSSSDWGQYGLIPKLVSTSIIIHEGRLFGVANQLLMLFATLAVITLCISATILWWRRRPSGRLGAPPMPDNFPVWKGAVTLMLVLGVLFPLMGISLIAMLMLDRFVIARIPTLNRVLG